MKDVVIGSITNYKWNQIKHWVNSLDRSGFDGLKVMVCYNVDYDTVEELAKRNYTIFAFGRDDDKKSFVYDKQFSIVVERFVHMWYFLKNLEGEYRYVISTDVRDVVFQKNPSEWLEENLGDKTINASSESIHYKNEPWGRNNLFKSFGPMLYDAYKDNLVYNAGVLAGEYKAMTDLFLNIYMLCNGTNHQIKGGGGPDQAALNILLGMETYKNTTNFARSEHGWAAQLGTTGPQIFEKYKDAIVEQLPVMKDGYICTGDGKPFTIAHQYDRVPEWKDIIEKKFDDEEKN